MISKLREFQIGQMIRQEGPTTHRPKAGTPTMGGLLILTAAIVPTLLWANLRNVYVWIAVLSTAAFGAVGFADDYLKIVRRSHHGLRPRYKMLCQVLIGAAVGVALLVLRRTGVSTAPPSSFRSSSSWCRISAGGIWRSRCSCWLRSRTRST